MIKDSEFRRIEAVIGHFTWLDSRGMHHHQGPLR